MGVVEKQTLIGEGPAPVKIDDDPIKEIEGRLEETRRNLVSEHLAPRQEWVSLRELQQAQAETKAARERLAHLKMLAQMYGITEGPHES